MYSRIIQSVILIPIKNHLQQKFTLKSAYKIYHTKSNQMSTCAHFGTSALRRGTLCPRLHTFAHIRTEGDLFRS